jgi:hypothetical protein
MSTKVQRLPPLEVALLMLSNYNNRPPVRLRMDLPRDRQKGFGRRKNTCNSEFNITKRTDYANQHGVLSDLLQRRVDVELGC